MSKSIEPQLCTIESYLKLDKESTFLIPEYQRPYVWEREQCEKLWQDINEQIDNENNSSYFFGTIIINCNNQNKELALIDGQQRTTTFILLLKALLLKINESISNSKEDQESESLLNGLKERRKTILSILYKAEAEDISLKPSEEKDRKIQEKQSIYKNQSNTDFFKDEIDNILKPTSFDEIKKIVYKKPKAKKEESKYSRYFINFKYFWEKAKDLEAPALNVFTKTLTNKCQLIQIKSWDFEQAVNMFNTLNGDGVPLRDSDIIFGKLYSKAQSQKQLDEFSNIWLSNKNKLSDLYKNGIFKFKSKYHLDENPDFDPVFTQYMYYLRAHEALRDNKETVDTSSPGLRTFFCNSNNKYIDEPIVFINKINTILDVWNRLSNFNILKVLLNFNSNLLYFIPSFFIEKLSIINNTNYENDSEIKLFLSQLLRLFALYEIDKRGGTYSSSIFRGFLFRKIIKFVNNKVSALDVCQEFDKQISSTWKIDEVKELIMYSDSDALVFLNEYLFAEETNYEFDISKPDIEHIMPKSGRNNNFIKKDANIAVNDNNVEFESYLNRIGNKILLELEINRSLGNSWFKSKLTGKVNDKKNLGYRGSIYPLARHLVKTFDPDQNPLWTKEQIDEYSKKAGERISKFIFNI